MTSITWAGSRCVQEAATFLRPQNRTQGRCDIYYLYIYISTIYLPQGHGGYALSFFVCEVLALVNVIVQIYFTDA